jgi:hypothetical protein
MIAVIFERIKPIYMSRAIVKFSAVIFLATLLFSACKKKKSGICYCSYLSGDKKEFNLTSLTRSQQIDSCYVLDGYAEAFAGDCKLK